MQSFTVDENTKYLCAGPVGGALNACKLLENGSPEPTCWDNPPTSHLGGTVLVHDVDMRIPVQCGKWRVGWLYSFLGHKCGGMVWHENVGTAADAANLLYTMENAGAPVICNYESDEIKKLGIRFIGRYSWQDDNSDKDPLMDDLSRVQSYVLRGPSFYFASHETFRDTIIPQLASALSQADEVVCEAIESRQASGEVEMYDGQFRDEAFFGRSDGTPSVIAPLTDPQIAVYDAGVGFSFAKQEYLFGRVWLNETKQCYAMSFYTYASPDFFAFMSVDGVPVCPLLPLPWPDTTTVANSAVSNPVDFVTSQLALICDVSDVAVIIQSVTEPLRNVILKSSRSKYAPLLEGLLLSHSVTITTTLFDLLMHCSPYTGIDDNTLLTILSCTSDEVLRQVGEQEMARFRLMHDRFLARPNRPFECIDEAYAEATSACHLAEMMERNSLVVFEELLRRGYPAGTILARTDSEWPRTVLAQAALDNNEKALCLLLDAGASVDEGIAGDEWNAIVYAVYAQSDAVVEVLRLRYPDNAAWTRHDIPLDIKKLPSIFAMNFGGIGYDETVAMATGSLEDLAARAAAEAVNEHLKDSQRSYATVTTGNLTILLPSQSIVDRNKED